MIELWGVLLRADPIAPLLECDDAALRCFVERDLRGARVPVESLWDTKPALRILSQQAADGSWRWKGITPGIDRFGEDYTQIETYRRLGQLVEVFGFNRRHEAIAHAAEYLFTCQSSEGDFRGFYGRQYAPNFTGGILELLVKAGYGADPRVRSSFDWLLFMRQSDGGWALPVRTVGFPLHVAATHVVQADREKPFSHLVTGMVLRAFAAHPEHCKSEVAKHAAHLLVSRFFQNDAYTDRGEKENWLRPSYPFWFTDLVSALDAIARIGLTRYRVEPALEWILDQQDGGGVFRFRTLRNRSVPNLDLWLTLAVCRVLKRLAKNAEAGRAETLAKYDKLAT